MREPLDHPISVNLTKRQHEALTAFARSQGTKRGKYVRLLITDDVPREFYRPLDPPPGQMRLGE